MTEVTLAGIITKLSAFFTQAMTWAGSVLGVVTDNPGLVIMVCAIPIIGFAFGLINRILRV